jgi:hypothetical protein
MQYKTYINKSLLVFMAVSITMASSLYLLFGASLKSVLWVSLGLVISFSISLAFYWFRKKEYDLISRYGNNNIYRAIEKIKANPEYFDKLPIGSGSIFKGMIYRCLDEYRDVMVMRGNVPLKEEYYHRLFKEKLCQSFAHNKAIHETQDVEPRVLHAVRIYTILDSMLKKIIQQEAKRPERLLFAISFWVPRKYREALVGDIMEDCQELRNLDKGERRIFVHVFWQLAISLVTLLPASIFSGLLGRLKLKDNSKE